MRFLIGLGIFCSFFALGISFLSSSRVGCIVSILSLVVLELIRKKFFPSPAAVVRAYLMAKTPEERSLWVLYSDDILPLMKQKYGNQIDTNLKIMHPIPEYGTYEYYNYDSIVSVFIQSTKKTDSLYDKLFVIPTTKCVFYLKKEKSGYKIDWAFSQYIMGYRDYGIKKMQSDYDNGIHSLFDVVAVSDYYNWGFISHKKDMYSFRIGSAGDILYGYCYKNDLGGKNLHNTLLENDRCFIFCEARYTSLSEERSECAEISNIKFVRYCADQDTFDESCHIKNKKVLEFV